MIDSVPPHDLVTERCVLRALMDDTEWISNLAFEMLVPEDFYSPSYSLIYGTMLRQGSGDCQLARATLVGNESALDAIRECMDQICSPANIEHYCQRLLALKAQRRAQIMGHDLVAGCATETPAELSARLHAAADDITAKAPAVSSNPVKELYDELDDACEGRRFAAPMPWVSLSKDTRALLPGTVTILCGSPGATKSMALIQLVRFLRDRIADACVCALMLEDGASYHLRRAAAQMTGISDITDDAWCRANPDKVTDIKQQLGERLDALRRSIEAPSVQNKCSPDELVAWIRAKARTHRVLAIDPITMMVKGAKAWEGDEKFLFGAKRTIEEHGTSLVLVTHPRKMPTGASPGQMSMDDLAGGSAYSRFSQTILYLRAHDVKSSEVERDGLSAQQDHNRTVTVFKARNGRGVEGRKYAFRFDPTTLTLHELGRVQNEK